MVVFAVHTNARQAGIAIVGKLYVGDVGRPQAGADAPEGGDQAAGGRHDRRGAGDD
jgi:hypothetical protein